MSVRLEKYSRYWASLVLYMGACLTVAQLSEDSSTEDIMSVLVSAWKLATKLPSHPP